MGSMNPAQITAMSGRAGLDVMIADVDKLVSLPDIYYRLESAIVDPSTNTDVISRLLLSDADLCARLLRIANSAFYSFPTPVESIERAVSNIGLRQIRELILVTTVVKAFNGIPVKMVNMAKFWEHSITVAILTRALGRHARLPDADSYYIPGLLHDIGHLVMYIKLPGLMYDLLLQQAHQARDLFQLELQSLGYSHADIGGRLLEFWNLPVSIFQPVLEHHDPLQGSDSESFSCLLHIADVWVNANRLDSSGGHSALQLIPGAMALLDMDPQELDEIGRQAGEQSGAVLSQLMSN